MTEPVATLPVAVPPAVVRADPAALPSSLKEAIVDSMVNLTFARISGHGEEGRVLYGARPRALLSSAFLLPRPDKPLGGDEVTQPIHISAHGLDFQVFNESSATIHVTPVLQVYVRVLPTIEDLKRPDCAPRFRLNDETRRGLQIAIREGLKVRWEIEAAKGGYKKRYEHPLWKQIEAEVRDEIHKKMGLPKDLKSLFSTEAGDDDGDGGEGGEGGGSGSGAASGEGSAAGDGSAPGGEGLGTGLEVKEGSGVVLKDDQFKPMEVPHKWLRIPLGPLSLPGLTFLPTSDRASLAATCVTAGTDLTVQLQIAIAAWAASDEGRLWGYRTGLLVYPSHYKGWAAFLDEVRKGALKIALPEIKLEWDVSVSKDWGAPGRLNVHVALENKSEQPKRKKDETEESVFQVHLELTMPKALHAPLKLGRVKASYRYNRYLEYPAMGFNGGAKSVPTEVEAGVGAASMVVLQTTWAPRYTQPRIIPKSYDDILPHMRELAKPEGLAGVMPLGARLETWFTELPSKVSLTDGLELSDAAGLAREAAGFEADKLNWRREIDSVQTGLRILAESKTEWEKTKKRGEQSSELANVYEAWLSMNETMFAVLAAKVGAEKAQWRLFQLAFIVANVPAMASRMPGLRHEFVKERDDTVTLLYFATGGGKSEAFFGLLVFTLFLDRLRGKRMGVTAMLRYPLRLLTIQQAQRCSKVLAQAEQVRSKHKVPGDEFAIGFWVGSGGSPNSPSDPGIAFIPDITEKDPSVATEKTLREADVNYELQNAAWNKIPKCPYCGTGTALRMFKSKGGTLAHVCGSPKCFSNIGGWRALPFYICDTDIYDFAPSVLLGTVDKLALIGQSSRTLRRIYAMLGAAPWRHVETGRLRIPNEPRDFKGGPEARGCVGLYPAYSTGEKAFLDPFPSLIIQDEAHLLDESLGTFAGLFESALDAIFFEMAKPLHAMVSREPDGQTRRRAKIIAASATVSDPQRQLEHLYQRPVPAMQFPYPGQSLYESFYAEPAAPVASEVARAALKSTDVERWAQWARVYVGFMTNGRPHTATTVAVLANFHAIISELLLALTSGDAARSDAAKELLRTGLSNSPELALYTASLAGANPAQIATVVDLHRIALTYVTNKKGGDQIMAAEFEETRKRHADKKIPITDLKTSLITGSVSQGEIQQTVEDAQRRPAPGQPFEPLEEVLRSVIATSAVSHGVDVEELNSMFFAGMPSDIAEYIQASSRIGRTHPGFVVLIPTPQRRRDRYIVEVFDSFHRFLERMVSPAAIDRWAGRAIERVMPSFIQAYLAGVSYVRDVTLAEPDEKENVHDLAWIPHINKLYKKPATQKPLVDGMCAFIEKAIGLDNDDFAPGGKQYYQKLIKDKVHAMLGHWASDPLLAEESLFSFFSEQHSVMNRPMTSLRDVDESGVIHLGGKDLNGKKLGHATARRVMGFIRNGVAESTDLAD